MKIVKKLAGVIEKAKLNAVLLFVGCVALAVVVYFIFWLNHTIDVRNDGSRGPVGSLAGIRCQNAASRPVAVMLSSDEEARPLSGIGQADMVIEMPVAPNGITRMMGIFQCQRPEEIGSVRSAREDFIPLAAGLGAIYAHWGGEQGALERLNQKVIDNVNGLVYDGTVFFRKKGMDPPHNGFTSFTNLQGVISELGYATLDTFAGYPHKDAAAARSLANIVDTIDVPYPEKFAVSWHYDEKENRYLRTRSQKSEIDKITGQQVRAAVVILMETTSQDLSEMYISIETQGKGNARVFQDGVVIDGTWRKDSATLGSKLTFLGRDEKEIKFTPGPIWVEVVTGSTQ